MGGQDAKGPLGSAAATWMLPVAQTPSCVLRGAVACGSSSPHRVILRGWAQGHGSPAPGSEPSSPYPWKGPPRGSVPGNWARASRESERSPHLPHPSPGLGRTIGDTWWAETLTPTLPSELTAHHGQGNAAPGEAHSAPRSLCAGWGGRAGPRRGPGAGGGGRQKASVVSRGSVCFGGRRHWLGPGASAAGSWGLSPEPRVLLSRCIPGFGSLGWAGWGWPGLSWTEGPAPSLGCLHLKFGGRAGAWAARPWEGERGPALRAVLAGLLRSQRWSRRPHRPGAPGVDP